MNFMPPQQTINHGLQVQVAPSDNPSILNKETVFRPPTLIREEAFYFPFKKDVKKEDTQHHEQKEARPHAVVQ